MGLLPRFARSEDSLRYKFQSWQEDAGRIRVDSHYALIEKELARETKLRLVGLIDAITGATPTGQPAPAGSVNVPVSQLRDRRKAWSADLSRQFTRSNFAASYSQSRESDYISNAWAINTVTDFNQKNTSLLVGYAHADDDVTARFLPAPRKKRNDDLIVGVTQLLNPKASLTFNLTRGTADGYLSDPYKIIQKNTEIVPGFFLPLTFAENRPEERGKWIVFAGTALSFPQLHGTLDANYRLFRDDWGTQSDTVSFEWYQSVGERFIVRPLVRLYRQSAADFYRLTLDGSSIVPGSPASGRTPFYSADYRLSELETVTLGMKAVWTVIPGSLTVDAAYERYTMRGRDRVTLDSAYPNADVITVGFHFAW